LKIRYIILLTLLTQCVEPFEPEGITFEQLFVVDGIITDEFKVHEISLSQTTSLDTAFFSPVTGATMSLTVDDNSPLSLTETTPGIYITPLLQGIVGSTYQLEIETPSGQTITSEPVVLKPTPEIKCVEARFLTEDEDSRGIDISITTEPSQEDLLNLRWTYSETYEFHSIFPFRFDWSPETGVVEIDINEANICFKGRNSTSTNIFTGVTQEIQQARDQSIRFLPEFSEELEDRYSIEVTQYSLSQDGYNYWEILRELNNSQGSTFDIQPGRVIGNLSASDGSVVLGYFDASEVSVERIFITPVEFEGLQLDQVRRRDCSRTVDSVAPDNIDQYMQIFGERQNIVGAITGGGWIVASKECTDCRLFGTNVKPSFWP